MFSFANPEFLYLLLLLPAVGGAYVLSRMARRRNLRRFGNPEVLAPLAKDVSHYKPAIRLGIELTLIAAIAVMLARPRYGSNKTTNKMSGVEVAIAIDVSNSMNAAASDGDNGITRLQQAKLVMEKLIDKLEGDKVSLIVFAGKAYMQMPMTVDAQSAKMFLNDISTNNIPTQGTAIGSAIEMSARSFTHDKSTSKAIVLITDGENFEDDAEKAAKTAAHDGIQVNVMGVGSNGGSPIPLDGGGFMTDDEGKQVLTRLDKDSAKKIADAGKGKYVDGDELDAAGEIADGLAKLAKGSSAIVQYSRHNEQFTVLAWIALLLLLADVLLLDKANAWLSKFNFFTREKDETIQE